MRTIDGNDVIAPNMDDGSTGLVDIGFEVDFFGTMYSQLYVNNNGNVTFDANLGTFTPFGLTTNLGTPIIAPFFADVETRGIDPNATDLNAPKLVTYGTGTVNGRNAFGVNWVDVGYFSRHTDKLCIFYSLDGSYQLVRQTPDQLILWRITNQDFPRAIIHNLILMVVIALLEVLQ